MFLEPTYITDISFMLVVSFLFTLHLLRILFESKELYYYLIGNLDTKYKIELGADIADKVRDELSKGLIETDYINPESLFGCVCYYSLFVLLSTLVL